MAKIIIMGLAIAILIGCGSISVSGSKGHHHFAESYYYYDKPLVADPNKDTILFFRQEQVLTPILAVIDGKFFPSFTGVVSFEKIKKLQVFAMANTWGGGASQMTGEQVEFEIAPCAYDQFLPTDKRYSSIGIYANRRIAVEIKPTPNRCVMGVQVGGDTYNTSECMGTEQWTTDLNGNGKPETWIAFPQFGEWVQVWENFGEPESALILDTAHPPLPNPNHKACDNSRLFMGK